MCGGDIHAEAGAAFGTCDSCQTTSTLPRAIDDRIVNLFNRANHFRRQYEFDQALAIYDSILNEDATNAEAHWGVVLCRYGIEYIEDPKTKRLLPTCHRTQQASILFDINYLAAIENAIGQAQLLYKTEANEIAEIQKKIIAIANSASSYDVFICYKETSTSGGRTLDSTFAQDIYYQLVNSGVKVFFSRITLEDRLGVEYEPYIFNALNTARVMLVVGTKKEYFEAVWVKNEWSRFLSLMKNDRSRLLIPCFRDMSAYDIPGELAHFQAQDMGKIGFMQDLLRGVQKALEVDNIHTVGAQSTSADLSLDRQLQNCETYIKLSKYDVAKQAYEKISKEFPEDYRGWWGIIISISKNLTTFDILQMDQLDTYYKYVQRLATGKDLQQLTDKYVTYIKNNADVYVDNEISTVNKLISVINSIVRTFGNELENLDTQKKQRTTHYHSQLSDCENARQMALIVAQKSEAGAKTSAFKTIFGSIMIVMGILMITLRSIPDVSSGMLFFIGVAIVTAGAHLLHTSLSKKNRLNATLANMEVSQAANRKNEYTSKYNKDMESFDMQIASTKEKVVQKKKDAAVCETYLAQGREKICAVCIAHRCAIIGIEKHADEETMQLKDQVARIAQGR